MTPTITLHEGDCRVSLRRLIDQGVRVHSVVTDPPYGLVSVTKRFGKEGSAPAKHGTDGAFARASKGFMGKCFHPDTEIMTDRGWRRVTDVQIGDTVATLNPETRELAWQAVEQTHAYPFEGELLEIVAEGARQIVTPNHMVPVNGGEIRLKRADDISRTDVLCGVGHEGAPVSRYAPSIDLFPYAGFVYCVGVPRHHILYTRFNGKPVWSGNSWDGTGIERDPEFWRLIYEILLPGGMVFAFSGARTGHWQACAMEMAGFIMHPMHGWLNGSGMPKAHNPVKHIDALKLMGGARTTDIRQMEMGEDYLPSGRGRVNYDNGGGSKMNGHVGPYEPKTPEAAQWDGWRYGTQTQKPALEPVYLGQKPFSEKNGALNLLKHGVGAFNIDDCRVPSPGDHHRPFQPTNNDRNVYGRQTGFQPTNAEGRWPANLLHDDSDAVRAIFPDSKGQIAKASTSDTQRAGQNTGSAARFFNSFPTTEEDYLWAIDAGLIDDPDMTPAVYHGKATKGDRAGSKHPTVKPVSLMEHFIRHITPPGGTVLDPFGGSGTTAEAARRLGMNAIIMEAEPDYIAFLRERFNLDSPPETVTPRSTVSQFSRATVGADIMSFLT